MVNKVLAQIRAARPPTACGYVGNLHLYSYDTAYRLLHTLVQTFDPDWLVWCSNDLYEKQKEPDRPTPDGRGYISGEVTGYQAGWANYLSDSNSI